VQKITKLSITQPGIVRFRSNLMYRLWTRYTWCTTNVQRIKGQGRRVCESAVFLMYCRQLTASNGITVQYLSQLLTQVKHLIKSTMSDSLLN